MFEFFMSMNTFNFNRVIFRKALDSVFEQIQNKEGLFRQDHKKFLPQYNLPNEFEYLPEQNQVKMPFEAGLWLWSRTFCDRRSHSSVLAKSALNAWKDKNLRWMFFPKEVVQRSEDEVKQGLREGFSYSFLHPNESSIEQAYQDNAKKLIAEYDGDPRNLIHNNSVEESRKNIMEFDKYGTGLANLYISEVISREISLPIDPENALVKIDVHRERIPISIGAVTTKNEKMHHGYGVKLLEQEYLKYYQDKGLSYQGMISMDHALWTIGSEVCAKQDLRHCEVNCSLESICKNVPKTSKNGTFTIYEKGRKVDVRKGDKYQLKLF
ncbi:MAG: hypothetical protein PF542_01780 [Nanoarchaeota archaeon]|jgi:hypothetical protein|nr:hypothetical protein [Nanoarchaeota archaeon]